MSITHIDFETRGIVELKKTGVHVYADHPDTDAWCMAYAIDDGPVKLWKMWEPFPADIDMNTTFMAHNAVFELAIWNRIMVPRYGWPQLKASQCLCTMAMAYAMALPGSLENAAAALGLEIRKDMEGRNLMMRMAKPRRVEKDGTLIWWDDESRMQRLYEYCIQDVEVERELEKRLLQLTPEEQQLWLLDYEINERGIAVDVPTIDRALQIVDVLKEWADEEIYRLTRGTVKSCSQVAVLTAWIESQGVMVDGLAKADVTELLSRDDLPADVRRALELRRDASKSSTAKLKAMRESASADGRVRGTMQYHAASTGRWGGRRMQPHNMPRPVLDQPIIEQAIETIGGR
jgi:DNA polymerase